MQTDLFPLRASGVLLHPSSLPSGRLGEDAYCFVDWLAAAGQSYWQMLPLHPRDPFGSPYAARSAFAGDTGLLPAPPAGAAGEPFAAAWLEEWVDYAGEQERAAQQRFQAEWLALRHYACERGISVIGDLPLYLDGASCDAQRHPELFDWTLLAGAAPSPSVPAGQNWGVPCYDWPVHAADGFAWWGARLARELELVDIVRLDHFRGLQAYWALEPDQPDPAQGRFYSGPGRAFFEALRERVGGLPLVVEDLGLITRDVEELRDSLGLIGMTLVSHGPGSSAPPAAWRTDSVLYSSNQDSDTLAGWWRSHGKALYDQELLACRRPGQQELEAVLERILQAPNPLVILPVQDVLGLGSEARMNVPGTVGGANWRFRLKRPLSEAVAERLRTLCDHTSRLARQT